MGRWFSGKLFSSRSARWIIPIVVGVLVGLAIALTYASRPVTWTSTASILLRPTPGNAWSPDMLVSSQQSTIALTTEATLVNTPPVLELVNKDLGTDLDPEDGRVSATVASNTQILSVTFRANSKGEARDGAASVAQSFLSYRESQSTTVQDRRLDSLNADLKTAESRLQKWLGTNGPGQQSLANTQVQLWSSRVAALQESIGTAEGVDTDPGRMVAPPSSPTRQQYRTSLVLGTGIGVGAVVGAVGAWLLELRRNRTTKHASERRVREGADH